MWNLGKLWLCQKQLTGVRLNRSILQTCLLPCWGERMCHSWFPCRALYKKLKLGFTKMFFYQAELATHYSESVSAVEWTDLKVLSRATAGGLSCSAERFNHQNDSSVCVCVRATIQKRVKDRAHVGCVEGLMKRSAGTFRALCSWEASYSTGGVIKATIRLSNRPPSSDFSALTRSWWYRIERNNNNLVFFIGLWITFLPVLIEYSNWNVSANVMSHISTKTLLLCF